MACWGEKSGRELSSVRFCAALPERFHPDPHLREDVFDPASHFGTLPVGYSLLLGERVRFAALGVDVGAHSFGGKRGVMRGAFIGRGGMDGESGD